MCVLHHRVLLKISAWIALHEFKSGVISEFWTNK